MTTFYTGLLHFAGCTAESEIDARLFGDELSARAQMMAVAFGTRRDLIATAARVAHPERPRLARRDIVRTGTRAGPRRRDRHPLTGRQAQNRLSTTEWGVSIPLRRAGH